ncbi:MAG: nickel pincer cofactor biosynthesis protein LarB [Coriobacteriales bacterium]
MSIEIEDFANIDYDRERRCGFPEVIFGMGKSTDQMIAIAKAILEKQDLVLVTRVEPEEAKSIKAEIPDACYLETPRSLFVDRRQTPLIGETTMEILGQVEQNEDTGNVVVCCAGTSDLYVAEEAAITACLMGSHVNLVPDIGIAGVHRTLSKVDVLRSARVIVCCAGMEGALPSLVAGLVEVPVIAVPTSVGYGANLGGIAALLSMINSCASGVSVVNIDNGFGAGQIASRINRPSWAENK